MLRRTRWLAPGGRRTVLSSDLGRLWSDSQQGRASARAWIRVTGTLSACTRSCSPAGVSGSRLCTAPPACASPPPGAGTGLGQLPLCPPAPFPNFRRQDVRRGLSWTIWENLFLGRAFHTCCFGLFLRDYRSFTFSNFWGAGPGLNEDPFSFFGQRPSLSTPGQAVACWAHAGLMPTRGSQVTGVSSCSVEGSGPGPRICAC